MEAVNTKMNKGGTPMPTKAREYMMDKIDAYCYPTHENRLASNSQGCTISFANMKPSDVSIDLDSMIKEVVFNDPYTIINWKSGTKTVVKAQDGDVFDKEKGLTIAIMKYINGNGGNFNYIMKKWCE